MRLFSYILIILALGFSSSKDRMEEVKGGSRFSQQLISHKNYTVSYNRDTKLPNWVSWSITKDELKSVVSRSGFNFACDPKLLISPVSPMEYSKSGWDRGHMCPAADNKYSATAMEESFYMTNICPQDHTLNEKTWSYLETACRNWAQSSTVYVVCGPYISGKAKSHIGRLKVAVPDGFWKVVLRQYRGRWHAIGFIMPNEPTTTEFDEYAVTVDAVEVLTGFDFFSALDDKIEKEIESSYDLSKSPHSKHKN